MNRGHYLLTTCLAGVAAMSMVAAGCKKNEPVVEKQIITQDKPSMDKPVENSNNVICIFDGLALKAEPSKAGKWVASLSLCETAKWLGDSAVDKTDKDRGYQKIQLSDGKSGWAISWGLVVNGKLGAVKEDAAICKRPDLLTGTDEKIECMKPVAIIQEKGDWAEFVSDGKKKGGWIRSSSITTDPADVAVAVLALKKIAPKEAKNYTATVKAFVDGSPYPDSYFIKKLKAVLETQPAPVADTAAKPLDNSAAASGTAQPAGDTTAKK
jgi:hypothetical protein